MLCTDSLIFCLDIGSLERFYYFLDAETHLVVLNRENKESYDPLLVRVKISDKK